MDNKSAFCAEIYDNKIRKVIPLYDVIYDQITDLIRTYFGDRSISLLDTGCGTGRMGLQASETLNLSELVLCDPSEKMLEGAREKLAGKNAEFCMCGSEELNFENRFDVVTAIQCHHYFDRSQRETAVKNCFRALKPGGMFICFENTAPFTETGRNLVLKRIENFGLNAGRTPEEAAHHTGRYNTEYFPVTVSDHLELLRKTGFAVSEIFWLSYLQSGYYAVK